MGEAEYLGEVLLNFFFLMKRFTEIHKKIHKTISCTKVWQSSSKSASKLHSSLAVIFQVSFKAALNILY